MVAPSSVEGLCVFEWKKVNEENSSIFSDQRGRTWKKINKIEGGFKKVRLLQNEEGKVMCFLTAKRSEENFKGKICKLEPDEKALKENQFDSEIQAWKKIYHLACFDCCGSVFGLVNYEGKGNVSRQAMLMRYYPLGDLLDYIKIDDPMSTLSQDVVIKVGLEILTVLAKLAENNIAHKDIKPDNFLAEECEGGFKLKIVDFSSMVFDIDKKESKQALKSFAGTYQYAAPELVLENDESEVSGKVDVFSAGISLLLLICKREPRYERRFFSVDEESGERRYRVYEELAGKLRNSGDPFYLLVADMLNRNPEDRPTAQEALDRLKAIKSALEPKTFFERITGVCLVC